MNQNIETRVNALRAKVAPIVNKMPGHGLATYDREALLADIDLLRTELESSDDASLNPLRNGLLSASENLQLDVVNAGTLSDLILTTEALQKTLDDAINMERT